MCDAFIEILQSMANLSIGLKPQKAAQAHKSRSYTLILKTKYKCFPQVGIWYLILFYEMLNPAFFIIIPEPQIFFKYIFQCILWK